MYLMVEDDNLRNWSLDEFEGGGVNMPVVLEQSWRRGGKATDVVSMVSAALPIFCFCLCCPLRI